MTSQAILKKVLEMLCWFLFTSLIAFAALNIRDSLKKNKPKQNRILD